MSKSEDVVHEIIKEVLPHFTDDQLKIVRAILNHAYSQGAHDALMDTLHRIDQLCNQMAIIEEIRHD